MININHSAGCGLFTAIRGQHSTPATGYVSPKPVASTNTTGLKERGSASTSRAVNPGSCHQDSHSVDTTLLLTRCQTLQSLGCHQDACKLLLQTFKSEGGDLEAVVPCRNQAVNLALVHFWWGVNESLNAEKLLIAAFRQGSGDLQSGRPCKAPEINLLLAQYFLRTGGFDSLIKLAIATPAAGTDCKPMKRTVHFIRHAEGQHNLAARTDPKNWHLRDDLLDPPTTTAGKKQCRDFALSTTQNRLRSARLIVTSPMNRTIETATYCMAQLVNKAQWIALESIREQIGTVPCDHRTTVSSHRATFPHVNFDQITFDDDILKAVYQHNQCREPDEHVILRCLAFMKWLNTRPEEEIVVVSHGNFLFQLFSYVLTQSASRQNECTINYNANRQRSVKPIIAFRNCEMRSLILNTIPT